MGNVFNREKREHLRAWMLKVIIFLSFKQARNFILKNKKQKTCTKSMHITCTSLISKYIFINFSMKHSNWDKNK